MKKKKLATIETLARELVEVEGSVRARKLLQEFIALSEGQVLTIVANQSLHKIPKRYLRGRIYIASRGNLDLSSARAARITYGAILMRLAKVLASATWKKIYLVPTGHPTLSAAIKLAVYQVTRRNTIDVFYANGEYFDLQVSVREGAP